MYEADQSTNEASSASALVEYYKLTQLFSWQQHHGWLIELTDQQRVVQGVDVLYSSFIELRKNTLSVTTPKVRTDPTAENIVARRRVLETRILKTCSHFKYLQGTGDSAAPYISPEIREHIITVGYQATVKANLQDMWLQLSSSLASHRAARDKLKPMATDTSEFRRLHVGMFAKQTKTQQSVMQTLTTPLMHCVMQFRTSYVFQFLKYCSFFSANVLPYCA